MRRDQKTDQPFNQLSGTNVYTVSSLYKSINARFKFFGIYAGSRKISIRHTYMPEERLFTGYFPKKANQVLSL